MNNIVLKTALKTLLVLVIAFALVFGIASLGFPQHMATMFENMGNYSFATGYASLAYTYSSTTQNLARCVDDSVLSGDLSNVINFGEKLVAAEDFGEYCADRLADSGVDYKQFVYSGIACAKYEKGDSQGALSVAEAGLSGETGFPKNNAYALLAIRAAEKKDAEMKSVLLGIISGIQPDESQQKYHSAVLAVLNSQN